jgi:hypothetical protein
MKLCAKHNWKCVSGSRLATEKICRNIGELLFLLAARLGTQLTMSIPVGVVSEPSHSGFLELESYGWANARVKA